jgi:PIN domain nuclease of toxin-antitoxin system
VNLLLDTHVLVWQRIDSPRLPEPVKTMIDDPANRVIISAASAWEIATKARLRKLAEAMLWYRELPELIDTFHFEHLVITLDHVHKAALLPHPHKDPFDRILVAQAMLEDLELVSIDTKLAELGARVRW